MKNQNNIPYLFEKDGTDKTYMRIKNGCELWHEPAKKNWQNKFEKYYQYLDKDFSKKFRLEFHSRLWELTLISYLGHQLYKNDKLIKHQVKNKRCPDFCFQIDGQRFYLEANAPDTGKSEELNAKLEDISGIVREVPVIPYKERLCSAIDLKGNVYYYNDEKKFGYIAHIGENSGFVLAISMAKIPCFNQPNDYQIDLSCLLGLSSRKIPIVKNHKGQHFMGSIYYDEELFFPKSGSKKPIATNYFIDDACSHISAILISHSGWVFFPDAEQYGQRLPWEECRNDYILIHNPFAKIPLPRGYFSVYREISPEKNAMQHNDYTDCKVEEEQV